ncbi:DNA repair protein RadC [Butyrivibrio sp. XB500-5]|uniref:RadC family protein n=1 Tax=Butyrivibrio sp. XB500-5 TaxID=2364880 RepID=UPI000EAA2809|nr:DNA repair protein RadC [Butyrivibrio sp. XB500-5]RKM62607.1 DNA repair protein RadC [Butyrivibrio sp. XB500-5]
MKTNTFDNKGASASCDMLPYERFMRFGAQSLTDAELLAIIIRTGSNTSSPIDIARNVLALGRGKEKGLNCLYGVSLDELKRINGIGEVKAVKLKCIAEMAMRMSRRSASLSLDCSKPSEVALSYMEKLRHEEREKVILLCLNNKLRLIEECLLSIGTVNSASLSPRDVYMHALKTGASGIILIHNHPGGDPTPSRADVAITNKIRESGIMLDIALRDHIIIGDKSFYSFEEKGLLWQ